MRTIKLFMLVALLLTGLASLGWSACEGDTNCDGDVDGLDLANLAADFGTSGCGTCDDVINLIQALEARIADLEYKLEKVSRVDNNIYITNANLHIRNGTGSTELMQNGLGNLIVGYNEEHPDGNDRSGSHNIIVGWEHNYPGYAGIAVGRYNSIMTRASSAVGGYANTANGWYSSVVGGWGNTASGFGSIVVGGRNNSALGSYTLVAGGGNESTNSGGKAIGNYSAIIGGYSNTIGDDVYFDYNVGAHSVIMGGFDNLATGGIAIVAGGNQNRARSPMAAILGGILNFSSLTPSDEFETYIGDTGRVYVDATVVH